MAMTLRKKWLLLHRWLGLSVGLVFVLLGLTGSLLVFDHAIDEWLNPELLLVRPSGQPGERREASQLEQPRYPSRPPLAQSIIEAAERAASKPAISVSKPRVPNGVWTVWFSSGHESDPQFTAVYVDPTSLRITGQRVWGHDLMSWTYRLHYTLLAGRTGAIVVGLVGITLLVSILSGLVLWWPLWLHSLRAALAIRRGRLLVFDLHKSLGVASCAVLAVVGFTGVAMEFPATLRNMAAVAFSVTQTPPEPKSSTEAAGESVTADQAIVIAEKLFPDAEWDHLHPPASHGGVFEVALRQPGEVQRSYGRTQVFIDRYSGQVTAVIDPHQSTAADAFFAAQFPLHNGEAFGLAGRILVFVSGLAPAFLYVSGLMLWWRKRRARRRA